MKYIKENKKTYFDVIGIILSFFYLFSTYLAGSIYFPSFLNRVALLAFLAYGVYSMVKKIINGTFHLSICSIWYCAFICYTVISFPFSSRTLGFSSNHFYEMVVCFFITLFISEFVTTEKTFNYICWAYVLSSFILVFLLYKNGDLTGDYNERLGNEVSGNANVFATFIMYSVIYGLWLLMCQDYRPSVKAFLCLNILLNLYALMLSAGRKFFVIPFIFLYILLLLKSKNRASKSIVKYTVIMLVIVCIVYIIITQVPPIYNAIGIRMEQLINSITGKGTVDASSLIRSRMRKAAINEWVKKPLFGFGFDTFKYLQTADYIGLNIYSHCNYTELLYSGGLVYTSIYYFFFLYLIYKAFKTRESKRTHCAFAIAVVISQLILDYGGVFYDIAITQIILLLAAKTIELPKTENDKVEDKDRRCEYGKYFHNHQFAKE